MIGGSKFVLVPLSWGVGNVDGKYLTHKWSGNDVDQGNLCFPVSTWHPARDPDHFLAGVEVAQRCLNCKLRWLSQASAVGLLL